MSPWPLSRQEESSRIKNSYLSVLWPIDPETLAFRLIGNTVLSTQHCTTLKYTMRWNANGEFRAMHVGREGKSLLFTHRLLLIMLRNKMPTCYQILTNHCTNKNDVHLKDVEIRGLKNPTLMHV